MKLDPFYIGHATWYLVGNGSTCGGVGVINGTIKDACPQSSGGSLLLPVYSPFSSATGCLTNGA